jgi:hyperosmotically inducible protein
MKLIHSAKIVGCALVVLTSLSAFAQSSDATSNAVAAPSAAQAKASNRALQKSVRHTLARTKGLDLTNIKVRARSGAVTLEGSVPELPQSDLAAQAAGGVAGVTSVKNALTVRAVGQ